MAGEEGFEPSHAGIKVPACPCWHVPVPFGNRPDQVTAMPGAVVIVASVGRLAAEPRADPRTGA